MTIEQTVEIPADHRLTIEVPPEIPAGRAKAALTLTFETAVPRLKKDASWRSLFGMCKDSGDTLAAYMERRRADGNLERAVEQRREKEHEKFRTESNE
ncbi:MAG: hypothetical protein LBL64_02205 [Treponema sp.]|jgi:hypothetical protein|nr:hypothetical protein [Treponema sp.]